MSTITFEHGETRFRMQDPDQSTLRETIPGYDYEPSLCAVLKQLIQEKPDSVFLDIGGLYGFFSLFVSEMSSKSRIHCFEPNPVFREVLNRNTAAHKNIATHGIALSDREESLRFSGKTAVIPSDKREGILRTIKRLIGSLSNRTEGQGLSGPGMAKTAKGTLRWLYHSSLHLARNAFGIAGPGEINVACLPFDQWASEAGVQADIAKIDVHGAEVKVLRGMKKALRDQLTHVIVEVHANHMIVDGSYRELIETLEEAGFRIFDMRDFRRRSEPELVAIEGQEREQFIYPENWTLQQNIEMRMIFATKTRSVK